MSEPIAASAAEISGQDALNALSGDERVHYQLTGELPDPKPVEMPDDEPDEPEPEPAAAPIEATPAVQTPEKPLSKRQQQINDLIRRATESDLRAKTLEAQIEALKARQPEPAKPAAVEKPAPSSAPAAFPSFEAWIAQDGHSDKTFEDFIDARADWRFDQRREAERREAAQREHETTVKTALDAWVERREAFAATHPDFLDKTHDFLNRVETGTPMGDAIVDSPVGPALALYLAEHPDEVTRIVRLPPVSALRALGKLEARFDPESLTSASASAGPAAKTVTTAPAPPMTLRAQSVEPADDVESALASRDFRAYEAAQNRRDLARK